MASPTLGTVTIFVWILNVMMILSQLAVADITPQTMNSMHFYDCSGSIIQAYVLTANTNCTQIDDGLNNLNITQKLPTGAVPNNNWFIVDWITSGVSWVGQQAHTFTAIATAPYQVVKQIPMFSEPRYAAFAVIIGAMWWGISLYLIVAFIFGR